MMKKMLTLILFTILFSPARAPGYRVMYLIRAEKINYYDPLIKAVCFIESRNGKYLNSFDKKEKAVGWFQIRQCRVDAYNELRGTNYKLQDFYDYNLSKEMFLYYAHGKSYEKAAKDWNGSGPMTINYWNQIKSLL
jgi:hypothetical protein